MVPLITCWNAAQQQVATGAGTGGRLRLFGFCSWVFQNLEKNVLLSFRLSMVSSALLLCAVAASSSGSGLQSQDLYRFRSVSEIEFSPDGRHIAYSVTMNDRPGRPYTQIWIMD